VMRGKEGEVLMGRGGKKEEIELIYCVILKSLQFCFHYLALAFFRGIL
jgi:hypothetical protein